MEKIYEEQQANDAEDSELDQFWQPLDRQKATDENYRQWIKEHQDNPKIMLEMAADKLSNEFDYQYKDPKNLFDQRVPVKISSTPVLMCYDELEKLQNKSQLFFKLPLK